MPIPDNRREDHGGSTIDYSFLIDTTEPIKKTITASDNDARVLFELWAKAEGNTDGQIKVAEDVQDKDIMRLRTRGFLTGSKDNLRFTNKGKAIISTMALGEVNKFEKNREDKSYTEILASMSKRGKKGFRTPKFASNNNNRLDVGKI